MRYLVPATDVHKRLDELEVPGLSGVRPEVPKPKKLTKFAPGSVGLDC